MRPQEKQLYEGGAELAIGELPPKPAWVQESGGQIDRITAILAYIDSGSGTCYANDWRP